MAFKLSFKMSGGLNSADVAKLLQVVDKANTKNLKSAGALLRKIARRSIRTRKKASAPGTPPSNHSKHPYATLKNILFDVEGKDLLTVGPVLFKQPKKQNRLATNAQEFGGTLSRVRKVRTESTNRGNATLAQKNAFKRRITQGKLPIRPATFREEQQVISLPKRPTMALALKTAEPKIPSIWTATVNQ